MDRPASEDPHAATEDGQQRQRDPYAGYSPHELRANPVLLQQITAHLQENHLHLPLLTPDPDVIARMKNETPELYHEYVAVIRRASKADYQQQTLPYTSPSRDVRFGQVCGVIVVLGVLVLAGYALYLDRPWVASLLAGLDIVALAAIFASGSKPQGPDHDT